MTGRDAPAWTDPHMAQDAMPAVRPGAKRPGLMSRARDAFNLFRFGALPQPSPDDPEFYTYRYGSSITGTRSVEGVPAAWCAVGLLANSMGRCRMGAGRVGDDRGLLVEWDDMHPASVLIRERPNRRIDRWQFWHHFFYQLFASGNTYAYIRRDKYGYPIELIPAANPYAERSQNIAETFPRSASRPLEYDLRLWGNTEYGQINRGYMTKVPERNVLHLHTWGFDGIYSPTPVQYAGRHTLATSTLTAEHHLAALENGIYQRLFLEQDAALAGIRGADTDKQRQQLREAIKEAYGGARNAGEVAVLPPGVKASAVGGLSAADLALIELAKWGVQEIARIWNVPPRMLHFFERGMRTAQSLEMQSVDFERYSIRPWALAAAAQFSEKLLNADDRASGMEIYVDTAPVRRGSETEVGQYAASMAAQGLLTINEGRELLGYGPVEGGDELMNPVGAKPREDGAPGGDPEPDPDPDADPDPDGDPEPEPDPEPEDGA